MASYFNLTLDTLAPIISAFSINNGASVTTSVNVTLSISCEDAASMKIWGINGVATESAASWETFSATKAVQLTSGDGSKTVYIKVRDSVYNESAVSSDTITLSTFISGTGIPENLDTLQAVIESLVPAHIIIIYEFNYLLIRDIHLVKTLAEMDALTLDKFGGG